MDTFFTLAVPVSILAVFVVLCFGIFSLMRGGKDGRSRSNQLMRLRVVVQFVAIVVLMAALWWFTRNGGGGAA